MSVHLDAARWKQLVAVNATVNALPYRADTERYGAPEFWDDIEKEGAGDCEDYGIAKRRRLRALGWPDESLRLAMVRVARDGSGHAVLTVDTDAGTYVLDSRYGLPQPWDRLSFEYDWVKRQAPTGPGWVEIAN